MIPKASLKKILKQNGAERVSAEAVDTFQNEVEEYANIIATTSVKFASHANRKTIKSDDISLACN